MSLQGVVADFATNDGNGDGTYTVTRRPKRTYSSLGTADAPGSANTFPITASVQPAGGSLVAAPQGRRSEDVRLIFTETELVTNGPAYDADIVTIGGEPFEVFDVDGPWEIDGFAHYQVSAARQRPTGGP